MSTSYVLKIQIIALYVLLSRLEYYYYYYYYCQIM